MIHTRCFVALATVILALASHVCAVRADYSGRLGIDYDFHDYNGAIQGSEDRNILRSIFRHTVDFNTAGLLQSEKYGSYAFGLSLDGYYDRSQNAAGSVSNYYAPDLKNVRSSLSLLPQSRVPLLLYYSRGRKFALDYEMRNRFLLTTSRPSLAIVRKYETRSRDVGGEAGFRLSPALTLRGSYQALNQQVTRLYDYGEDRDFYVQVSPPQSSATQSFYFVVFSNNVPESLTVYMDDTLLLVVPPNAQQVISIRAGLHTFDLRAPTYNTFRTSYDVNGNATWLIRYNPPAAPNDRDAASNALSLSALYEPSDRFRGELRWYDEDTEDAVLASSNRNRILRSALAYELGEHTTLQSLSNYSRSGTRTPGEPEDTQGGFSQITSVAYEPGLQSRGQFTHNLSVIESRGLNTTVQSVEAAGSKALTRRYAVDVKLRGVMLTDSRDFSRREFGFTTGHEYRSVDFGVAQGTLKDEFEVKTSTEVNPGRAQREYVNRLGVESDFGRLGTLGDALLFVEYVGRWFTDRTGDIFEGKYRIQANVSNNAWSRLKLHSLVTREVSKVTGDGSLSGRSTSITSVSLSSDLQLSRAAVTNVSIMMIDQKELDVVQYHASLNWVWPALGVRYQLSYDDEHRTYGPGDNESARSFSQKASFHWRRIEVLAAHEIVSERQRVGRSRYQGFEIKAQRRFEL